MKFLFVQLQPPYHSWLVVVDTGITNFRGNLVFQGFAAFCRKNFELP